MSRARGTGLTSGGAGGTFVKGDGTVTGTGDLVNLYAAAMAGRKVDLRDGTAATPITTSGPTFKVSRTEAITRATIEAAGSVGTDGSDQVAAIAGLSDAIEGSQTQSIGVFGAAKNASTATVDQNGSRADACGVYGIGRATATSTGAAFGGCFVGRRDVSTAKATGAEIHVANYSGVAGTFTPTGATDTKGLWINASGDAASGAAIIVQNAFGRQFQVGLGFGSQVNNGFTGGVSAASIQDDSTSARSIHVKGTHASAAIAVNPGSGSVGIGTDAPTSLLQIVSQNNTASTVLVKKQASQTVPLLQLTDENNAELMNISSFGLYRGASGSAAFPGLSFTADSDCGVYRNAADSLGLATGGAARQLWTTSGTQLGGTAAFGGGVGVVGITNATTVPTTNPSGGGILYTEAGALKYRGSSGTVTTLAAA